MRKHLRSGKGLNSRKGMAKMTGGNPIKTNDKITMKIR
tara:strand:- start:399 stop:512 length:114 start_codon:yes stop_codon:yes gene_type:complete